MENRNDFEPTLLLTEQEWKKKGYKIIVSAKYNKAVKGEDGVYRYDCNAVCRLKKAEKSELTTNEWLELGYVPKEGAFGREMHYYSRNGIFIYTKDEVEKDEAKVKAILEEKRKARNERQRQYRLDKKERKQELEQLLEERRAELQDLRKTFDEKQETYERLTEMIRKKKFNVITVAFSKSSAYDFITDKELDEYQTGEKIYIPNFDSEPKIVGHRYSTLRYDLVYPYPLTFGYRYKTLEGKPIKLEDYATTEEAKAFEEQRQKEFKRYNYLNDWCKEAEEKLWFGHY